MMTAWRLPNGHILVPRTASSGGVIGDGYIEVASTSKEARKWEAWTQDASQDIIRRWEQVSQDR